MADIVYNVAFTEMNQGGAFPIDLLNDAVRMGLYATGYAEDRDDQVADAGGANDFVDHEVSGTGYAAGYNGSGRQLLSSKTLTVDLANDRWDFDAADITWTGINVGAVAGAVLLIEDHLGAAGNDTQTRLVAHYDTNFPATTNGGNFTVQSPNDLIRGSTV